MPEVPKLLGLHPVGEHGGPHEVREQQCHEGALAEGTRRLRRDPLEDGRGAPVVRVDRPDLLGGGARRLQVAGLERRLRSGEEPFEESAEHRLGRRRHVGHWSLAPET